MEEKIVSTVNKIVYDEFSVVYGMILNVGGYLEEMLREIFPEEELYVEEHFMMNHDPNKYEYLGISITNAKRYSYFLNVCIRRDSRARNRVLMYVRMFTIYLGKQIKSKNQVRWYTKEESLALYVKYACRERESICIL